MVPIYNIGTATLTAGSATMTGQGTLWLGNVREGDQVIGYAGGTAIVGAVNSNTQITLTRPWRGAAQAAAVYEIVYTSDDVFAQALGRQVLQKISGSALMGLTDAVAAPRKGIRFDATSAASLFDMSDKAVSLLGEADEAAMRGFLQVAKKQADVLDATTGAGLIVGAFGLGGANGLQGAGADIAALSVTQIINAADVSPAGWDASLGSYPMGMHWQRSSAVQAQFAIGFSGEAGFRSKVDATAWQAWRKLFHNRNVVGTVAQSAGVPTGAIIERGSNANGDYTRWADGTQICTGSFSSGSGAWTAGTYASERQVPGSVAFPAAFSNNPVVQARNNDGQLKSTGAYVAYLAATATAMTNIWLVSPVQTGPLTAATTIIYEAYGRWF